MGLSLWTETLEVAILAATFAISLWLADLGTGRCHFQILPLDCKCLLRALHDLVRWPGLAANRMITLHTSMPVAVTAGPCNQPGHGPPVPTSIPTASKTPPQPEGSCGPHKGHAWSTLLWWTEGMVLLGPTGHLLRKTIPFRLEDVAELPKT